MSHTDMQLLFAFICFGSLLSLCIGFLIPIFTRQPRQEEPTPTPDKLDEEKDDELDERE